MGILKIKNPEQYRELRIKYENSIGKLITERLIEISTYRYFLDKNFESLLKIIKYYEVNWSDLWAYTNVQALERKKFDDYQLEFVRMLHNYLMSFYSLKDKTMGLRNHINKKYDNRLSNDEYTSKISEFKVDKYLKLLSDLRNDFTHGIQNEGLLLVEFSIRQESNSTKEIAEIFIRNPKTEIKKVIINYYESSNRFYSWFISNINQKFSKEIEDAINQSEILVDMQNNR